jgi:hypothetical protein
MKLYDTAAFMATIGHVRLEVWQEGLVLWVGGMIVYKSWEKQA